MQQGRSTARGRRVVAAILAGLVAVAVAAVAGPSAQAAPAPAATGWYLTSQRGAAGLELQTARRDDPLARAHVTILPRSGLYRLRTVLASEKLVGGPREVVTTLCARVHCHAAVNGDRWELVGHDAGRLVGAVAIGGQLVATQPLPPADPYAHLLVGHDGSMEGTIDFPIPVAPVVESGQLTLPVDVNRQPADRTSVITQTYNEHTRTPPDTVEYLFSMVGPAPGGVALQPIDRREGSGLVPPNGLVVAAHGAAREGAEAWWQEVLATGVANYRQGLGGVREVIGGSPLLLEDGEYAFPTDRGDGRQPRTIVGWSAERVWLVTVDGRRDGWSEGLTLIEAAQLMRWLGATDALNLDGGGSTTSVGFGDLRNLPSDGTQRPVASALVVMPPENAIAPPPPARPLDPACPPGRVPPDRFVDARTGVHSDAIDCVAWWGVAAGAGGGRYEPAKPVRRDQMATFLARYLYVSGVPLPSDPPDAFRDDDDSLHEQFIDMLAAMGVVGGRGDGTYAPAAAVSRGQMATFLARAVALANQAPLAHTADFFADDGGEVHEKAINEVTENGIAGGTADGSYRSALPVTRDQMASFLARALASTVEAGRARPPG